MRLERPARARKSNGVDVQAAARKALRKVIEPLAGFALDCGLSVNEVDTILREAAVRAAAGRQLEDDQCINISGIAAATGISRGEISRILRYGRAAADQDNDRRQNLTNRILRAWHRDPKFLTANREPAELKLYGRGPTFESLVKKYGRGIPARAIFDELTRIGAIDFRGPQEIFPIMSVAVDRRITPQMIKAFGGLAANLFSATLRSVRQCDASALEAGRLKIIESSRDHSKRRRYFQRVG